MQDHKAIETFSTWVGDNCEKNHYSYNLLTLSFIHHKIVYLVTLQITYKLKISFHLQYYNITDRDLKSVYDQTHIRLYMSGVQLYTFKGRVGKDTWVG